MEPNSTNKFKEQFGKKCLTTTGVVALHTMVFIIAISIVVGNNNNSNNNNNIAFYVF